MKTKKDNIIGQTVMVHPFLTTDPYNTRGKLVTVKEVRRDRNYVDLLVELPDKTNGLYEADALLILAPEKTIRKMLHEKYQEFNQDDRKAVLKVLELMKESVTTALLLSVKNEAVMSCCVVHCQEWIEMKHKTGKKQKRDLKDDVMNVIT